MLNKVRRGPVFWGVLLTGVLLTGLFATAGLAADPEPYLEAIPDSHFDAGPGWPAGWTPPQPPDKILPEQQAEYAAFNPKLPPAEQTTQLVLRVVPLPQWAPGYPYEWRYDYTNCGKTTYLYYYPYPDQDLLEQMTGDVWAVTLGGGGECGYGLVAGISKPLKPRPEEIERNRFIDKMMDDIFKSREGLTDCPDWSDNRPESIQVCLNGGDASQVFDTPAYLDTAISRVRVPVRFISEMMGADVDWNPEMRQVTIVFPAVSRTIVKLESAPGFTTADWWDSKTHELRDETNVMKEVTISQPPRTIILTVGQDTAVVDGHVVTIDAPPVIGPAGRTMVPLRFVSEQLGAGVYWIGNQPIFTDGGKSRGTYQVHIYTPLHPWFEAPNWYLKKAQ